MRCDLVFGPHHVGALGIVHGGAVATACDDLFGFVLAVAARPGVTRTLQVGYRRPVPAGVDVHLAARLDRTEGRVMYMSADGRDGSGALLFDARAEFVAVHAAHFESHGPLAGHPFLAGLFEEMRSRDATEAGRRSPPDSAGTRRRACGICQPG